MNRRLKLILWSFGAVAWLLVVLLGLEAFARFQAYRIDHHNRMVVEYRDSLNTWEEDENSLWEVPHWKYKRNASIRVQRGDDVYQVSTNRFGFRGKDIALPKPDGVYRIVCVGGSTTVGGWTDDTSYPAFLEVALNERLAG